MTSKNNAATSTTNDAAKADPDQTPAGATAASTKADAPKTTEAPKAAKKDRKFEVVQTLNLGGGDIRQVGESVKSSEIAPDDLKDLLKAGIVRDGDAPIPPSQAEGQVAYDRVLSIATKSGVVTRDGAEYSIGEATHQGLAAFRKNVSIETLEAAIVAKAKGR